MDSEGNRLYRITRYGGQYVEPDSVRDVGGNENPGGGYGAYGTGNMNGGYGQNGGTGYSYGQGTEQRLGQLE